jgi:hypothetical protein
MSKDAIDNGSAINVADYVEAAFNDTRPSAYPNTMATIGRTIDGDRTSYYSSGDEVEVDLGKIYKIKKISIRVGNLVSYAVYKSQTNDSSRTNLAYEPISSSDITYSNGVITYNPTTMQDVRWIKIEYEGQLAATSQAL